MHDHSPLVRQWILIRFLCSHRYGMTVQEIAQELGVSKKTVRRDLMTFFDAGFPLEEIVQERGRKVWRIPPEKCRIDIDFAFDEALALYLGRRFLEPLASTPFGLASKNAFDKVRTMLGAGAQDYIRQFEPLFHHTNVGGGDYSQKADTIDAIMVAAEDRQVLSITYQSLRATEPVTYRIHPYGMVYHHGSLYLVGLAPQHKEIRHWKLDRIQAAEALKTTFERPDDFDLRKHFERSFGVFHGDGDSRVRVRFAPEVARYIQESTWHPSQTLSLQKDGSVLVEFHLSTTEEVKRWIMGFGRHAVVLEPPSLIEEMAGELRSMLKAYSPKSIGVAGKS